MQSATCEASWESSLPPNERSAIVLLKLLDHLSFVFMAMSNPPATL